MPTGIHPVQVALVGLLMGLGVLGVVLLGATLPAATPATAPTYIYHNSTVYVNTTDNITSPSWNNSTVWDNTTNTVWVNTTLIESVPVVLVTNVTLNGMLLPAPRMLNISTGAVLWLQVNATTNETWSVNAPFVLLGLSSGVIAAPVGEWHHTPLVETLLVGVPYAPGIYALHLTAVPIA